MKTRRDFLPPPGKTNLAPGFPKSFIPGGGKGRGKEERGTLKKNAHCHRRHRATQVREFCNWLSVESGRSIAPAEICAPSRTRSLPTTTSPKMKTRRDFLKHIATGIIAREPARRKRMAIVTTEWRFHSHAWHMGERFLVGYPSGGAWHRPPIDVVSAYVDQFPENDLSRQRAKEFGFTIYPTVAEALRCGGKQLAVDAVLIIGEHGNYPKASGDKPNTRATNSSNRSPTSFDRTDAPPPCSTTNTSPGNGNGRPRWLILSRAMKFPFLAGSSLPVTWRMPSIEMPYGASLQEGLVWRSAAWTATTSTPWK